MAQQMHAFEATTFDRQTAVVTGAASGLGRTLKQSHSQGARLILAEIDSQSLAQVAAALGARVAVTAVADPRAMARLAARARLVCLNTGVISTFYGPVWEAPPEEWNRVLDIKLGSVVNGLCAFVPQLFDAGRPAAILITASLVRLATWPGGGPYATSNTP